MGVGVVRGGVGEGGGNGGNGIRKQHTVNNSPNFTIQCF